MFDLDDDTIESIIKWGLRLWYVFFWTFALGALGIWLYFIIPAYNKCGPAIPENTIGCGERPWAERWDEHIQSIIEDRRHKTTQGFSSESQ